MVNNGLFVYDKIQIETTDVLIYTSNSSCNTTDHRFALDLVDNYCEWGWYKVGPEELVKW